MLLLLPVPGRAALVAAGRFLLAGRRAAVAVHGVPVVALLTRVEVIVPAHTTRRFLLAGRRAAVAVHVVPVVALLTRVDDIVPAPRHAHGADVVGVLERHRARVLRRVAAERVLPGGPRRIAAHPWAAASEPRPPSTASTAAAAAMTSNILHFHFRQRSRSARCHIVIPPRVRTCRVDRCFRTGPSGPQPPDEWREELEGGAGRCQARLGPRRCSRRQRRNAGRTSLVKRSSWACWSSPMKRMQRSVTPASAKLRSASATTSGGPRPTVPRSWTPPP